jgi:hypothetical protein
MDGSRGNTPPPQWKGDLSVREQIQIAHAEAYAKSWSDAGIPGHNHIMLIAKLSALLEDAVSRFGYAPGAAPPVKVQKVAWSGPRDGSPGGCWRDLETGVRVEL